MPATLSLILDHEQTATIPYRVLDAHQIQRAFREDLVCVWATRDQLMSNKFTEEVRAAGIEVGPSFVVISVIRVPVLSDRSCLTSEALKVIEYPEAIQPPDAARWLHELLRDGPLAVLDAAADMLAMKDLSEFETNTLSAMGNAVSKGIRRRILLSALRDNAWSLKKTALALRLGTSGSVLRAIADLGLSKELEDARRRGLVTRAWNKKPPASDLA